LANVYLGRAQEVIDYADRAMRLSPFDPYLAPFHLHRGVGYFMLHRDDDAIPSLRRAVAHNPEHSAAVAWLAAVLALTGQEAEARDMLERYFLIPGTKTRTIARWRSLAYSQNPAYLAFRERFYDGLRKAGMPES
jgi:tetratricopeptide (TPR) repeat protein